MSRIPDCRSDEYYNGKYLVGADVDFTKGYDWAVEQMESFFANLEVFPEVDDLLADNKAVIAEGKAEKVCEALAEWMESQRDELITSMIDNMDEESYKAVKAKVDGGEKAGE